MQERKENWWCVEISKVYHLITTEHSSFYEIPMWIAQALYQVSILFWSNHIYTDHKVSQLCKFVNV